MIELLGMCGMKLKVVGRLVRCKCVLVLANSLLAFLFLYFCLKSISWTLSTLKTSFLLSPEIIFSQCACSQMIFLMKLFYSKILTT